MIPLHKKGRKYAKQNCRAANSLAALSKISKRSMFKQTSSFFEDIFSKHQCGFGKDFNAQQCLLKLLENWKNTFDKDKMFSALLSDFSKAFDCLNYELLIAKLSAYALTLPAFKLVHNYS